MSKFMISPIQHDYVTKKEFSEFKGEMREFRFQFGEFRDDAYQFKGDMYDFKKEMLSFREKTENRFISIDMRLDRLEKSITDLRNEIPGYMKALREGFQEDLKQALEYMTHLVEGISDKVDDRLENRQ